MQQRRATRAQPASTVSVEEAIIASAIGSEGEVEGRCRMGHQPAVQKSALPYKYRSKTLYGKTVLEGLVKVRKILKLA